MMMMMMMMMMMFKLIRQLSLCAAGNNITEFILLPSFIERKNSSLTGQVSVFKKAAPLHAMEAHG
jgi:hypothetical protein